MGDNRVLRVKFPMICTQEPMPISRCFDKRTRSCLESDRRLQSTACQCNLVSFDHVPLVSLRMLKRSNQAERRFSSTPVQASPLRGNGSNLGVILCRPLPVPHPLRRWDVLDHDSLVPHFFHVHFDESTMYFAELRKRSRKVVKQRLQKGRDVCV